MTAKLCKKQNFPNFDVLDDFAQVSRKIVWLSFDIHTSRQKIQIDV